MSMAESYPMNGGDGKCSYTKNSSLQREVINNAKRMVGETIINNLDIKALLSASNTFHIADLGCSVGPNTFICMENIIEAMKFKCKSQGFTFQIPEFQVFFNDHALNDFNTLFRSLPVKRQYFAAGVPGSFHGPLFPNCSLHFIHSSTALHWLSQLPKEILDNNSPAWNKGRIFYSGAANEVGKAYAAQFAKDMEIFLDARAKELVVGGIMVLMVPAISNGISHSCSLTHVMFDLVGSSLMDMAKEVSRDGSGAGFSLLILALSIFIYTRFSMGRGGTSNKLGQGVISEAQVDSFNLPMYIPSPNEMMELVERNGCFRIERTELFDIMSDIDIQMGGQAWKLHYRAGLDGILSKHFGSEIIDELFNRFFKKTQEFFSRVQPNSIEVSHIFLAVKRI